MREDFHMCMQPAIKKIKGMQNFKLQGQNLLLLPERAVFWQQAKMLIVADPHFGKAQVFRDSGIPVPAGTTADDLHRLSTLMEQLQPDELLMLGDLVHGRVDGGRALEAAIDKWRRRWPGVRLTLVSGNHDRWAGPPPTPFRIDRVVAQHVALPFVFRHEPDDSIHRYSIAGHLHPAVSLSGRARRRETLPCFCFGKSRAVLPAFGSFTGHQVIRPEPQERVFVVAGDEVIALKPVNPSMQAL